MRARANRVLDRILRSMGADVTGDQLQVEAGSIVPVAVMDQLAYTHMPAGWGRMWLHLIPSANVGQFSGFELVPVRGLWVRKMLNVAGATNATVALTYGGGVGAFAVNDSLAGITALMHEPENSDYPLVAGTNLGALSNSLFVQVPQVFRPQAAGGTQVGRTAASPGGVFFPAGTFLEDLWIPPGLALGVFGTATGSAISIQLQLDIPADVFFVT